VALNVFVTMLLGGLWHGASWMFVLWGAYHGTLLVLERVLGSPGPPSAKAWGRAARVFLTFHLVCLGWVLFRSPDLATFQHWLAMLASGFRVPGHAWMWRALAVYGVPLAAVWALQARYGLSDRIGSPRPRYQRVAMVAALYFGMTILGADAAREFIYFQF
jgi:hypothetical protein